MVLNHNDRVLTENHSSSVVSRVFVSIARVGLRKERAFRKENVVGREFIRSFDLEDKGKRAISQYMRVC